MFYRKPPNTGVFHRIGDSYARFIDGDHFLGRSSFDDNWMTHRTPVSAIDRTDAEYMISLALPGYKKEHIELNVENRELKLKAASSNDYPVYRTFELPPDAVRDGISAKFENSILVIAIKRCDCQVDVKSIPVQ